MTGPAGQRTARRLHRFLFAALLAVSPIACRTEVHHGLDEAEANEMVAALQAQHVDASKEQEGRDETWLVNVPAGDAARAWQVLRAAGLPRRQPADFEATFGEPGLIPSPTEEHVRFQHALAGDLERSIMAMSGVADAHVHLVLPIASGLHRDGDQPQSGAAVLLVQEPGGSVDVEAVRRLVAASVADLAPGSVEVVTTSRAGADAAVPPLELVQVGPIRVAPGSASMLKAVLAGLTGVVLLLSALLVFLVLRRRTAQVAP